jgi:hypothetical protein
MSVSVNIPSYLCETLLEIPSVTPQYLYYDDGVDYWRKGVRSGVFVLDHVIGVLGFYGTEGIGWENVWSVE